MASIYTTLENITKRMPLRDVVDLTDDDAGAEVNQTILDQAIADVGAEIDGKLRGRYPVPLAAPIPALIEHVAAILVIHNLYSRKHQLVMSDGLARQYKKATADLKELQEGVQILEGFESSNAHPGYIAYNKRPEDRLFSSKLLNRF